MASSLLRSHNPSENLQARISWRQYMESPPPYSKAAPAEPKHEQPPRIHARSASSPQPHPPVPKQGNRPPVQRHICNCQSPLRAGQVITSLTKTRRKTILANRAIFRKEHNIGGYSYLSSFRSQFWAELKFRMINRLLHSKEEAVNPLATRYIEEKKRYISQEEGKKHSRLVREVSELDEARERASSMKFRRMVNDLNK